MLKLNKNVNVQDFEKAAIDIGWRKRVQRHHTLHTGCQTKCILYLLGIALYCDNIFGYKHLVDKANIVNSV